MNDERVTRSKLPDRSGDEWHPTFVGNPDDLTTGKRRIREWSDEVHDGGDAELSPNGSDVTHRRVHERSEHEDDPRVAERRHHHWDGDLDGDSQRLEHVSAT